jgi:hypothetical protein
MKTKTADRNIRVDITYEGEDFDGFTDDFCYELETHGMGLVAGLDEDAMRIKGNIVRDDTRTKRLSVDDLYYVQDLVARFGFSKYELSMYLDAS